VQKIWEDPMFTLQKICQGMEDSNEIISKEFQKIQESAVKRKEEIEILCKENNVIFEEIKEISDVLNYGEQIVIENEEHLGTNQVNSMNIRNSIKSKKKKKREKTAFCKRKETKFI
jgi:hypothetical protein